MRKRRSWLLFYFKIENQLCRTAKGKSKGQSTLKHKFSHVRTEIHDPVIMGESSVTWIQTEFLNTRLSVKMCDRKFRKQDFPVYRHSHVDIEGRIKYVRRNIEHQINGNINFFLIRKPSLKEHCFLLSFEIKKRKKILLKLYTSRKIFYKIPLNFIGLSNTDYVFFISLLV